MEVAVLDMIALEGSLTFSQRALARLLEFRIQYLGFHKRTPKAIIPAGVADRDSSQELDNVEDALR